MQTVHRMHEPPGQAGSFSRYSQAVETTSGLRWLYISGQVGVLPDGALAPTVEAQHEQAWANVLGLLDAADMGVEHLVRVNAFVTDVDDVAVYRSVRDRVLGDARPASTLVAISALVAPNMRVEIEAVAAAP